MCRQVGLQCLIEVHSVAELERVLKLDSLDGCMLGINNRNLETFEVRPAQSDARGARLQLVLLGL